MTTLRWLIACSCLRQSFARQLLSRARRSTRRRRHKRNDKRFDNNDDNDDDRRAEHQRRRRRRAGVSDLMALCCALTSTSIVCSVFSSVAEAVHDVAFVFVCDHVGDSRFSRTTTSSNR